MDMNRIPASTVAAMLEISHTAFARWKKRDKLIPVDVVNGTEYYSLLQLAQKYTIADLMLQSKWNQEIPAISKRPYSSMEFFAGGGGLALGLEQAGFQHRLLVDKDYQSCETLRHNRPDWDVRSRKLGQAESEPSYFDPLLEKYTEDGLDLIAGGFPCQPFSFGGKGGGFGDSRGTAFFEFATIIRKVKPKMILAENVKGLLYHDKGRTIKVIIEQLERLGYTLSIKLMNSMFYRVPQRRERLIIVGIQKKLADGFEFQFPSVCGQLFSLRDALRAGSLYPTDVPESEGFLYNAKRAAMMDLVPAGGNWRDLPETMQREWLGNQFGYTKAGNTGMARRLAWDDPSLTIMTEAVGKQNDRCHPEESRPLRIREYARIQTFPDDWNFFGSKTAQYMQIGNAVPVNMSAAIGRSLIRALNSLT